jgi:hypothetical protein
MPDPTTLTSIRGDGIPKIPDSKSQPEQESQVAVAITDFYASAIKK